MHTTTLPAVTLTAAAAPDARPEIALPTEPRPWLRAVTPARVGIVVAAALGAWLLVPYVRRGIRRLAERRSERRRRYEASEPVAFARVRTAALGNDAAGTYAAVGAWLARFRPGDAATLARLCDVAADPDLRAQVDTLARQVYGARAKSWSGRALLADLERARTRMADATAAAPAVLPPLNPA